MISVISPAKKLDFEHPAGSGEFSTPALLSDSERLNRLLREYSALDLMELMNISNKIAELNAERNYHWKTPFNSKNAKQAIFAFRGDVYKGLDADTLKPADLKFAQKHLRILSGLYGILRPLDLMQPYRLEMGTRLRSPRGKNLYEFWGTRITDHINGELARQKSRVLVNLASNEYFKAIVPGQLGGEIITPVFKEKKGRDYRVIGIHAKKARGLMSRFIIKGRIDQPEALKEFELEGYHYNEKLSDDSSWVFVR